MIKSHQSPQLNEHAEIPLVHVSNTLQEGLLFLDVAVDQGDKKGWLGRVQYIVVGYSWRFLVSEIRSIRHQSQI